MNTLFLNYPKCSTCTNARKWLEENNISFENRDIVKNNPTKEELKKFLSLSGLPVKKFFNTSGILYRELNLKEKLQECSEDEALEILSTNGMLVKRPLVVSKKGVLLGFKKEKWEEFFK